jgi:2-keto-4-pentenoate hydratase
MTIETENRAAKSLWEAWTEDRPLVALAPDCRPDTIAAGYAIQDALDGLAGPRIGWKVAGTAAAAREMLGVDEPLSGPLYERFSLPPGAEVRLSRITGVVEAEFAVKLGRDLPGRPRPYERDDIVDAVASIHPALEFPGSRFEDYASAGAMQMVADAAGAGVFVIGRAAADVSLDRLPQQQVTLRASGRELAVGHGSNVLGDPLEVVAWLANNLSARGRALLAGEIVLTGAAALSFDIGVDDQLTGDFGPLGEVSARVA